MNYSEVVFLYKKAEEWQVDLLVQDLATLGFDTFEERDQYSFSGFIASAQFDAGALDLLLINQPVGFEVTYEKQDIVTQNWNKVWEENFKPIVIDKLCYVRATFHSPEPSYPYEIIIDPKMAFGTGHHQTTSMMMRYILATDFSGQEVLDMGCGTGILTILAIKRNAKSVLAVDYDPICVTSTLENTTLNQVSGVETLTGSVEQIEGKSFDIILANINRNIILDHISKYAAALRVGGKLFLSGFFHEVDLEMINEEAEKLGLKIQNHLEDGVWASSYYIKL